MFLLDHITFIIVMAFHVGGVLLAFPALLHTRTPQGTLAWVMSLIVFPYVAVPLYFVLGPRRFEGYIRARRRKQSPDSSLRSVTSKVLGKLEKFIVAPDARRKELYDSLTRLVDFNPYRGNSCKILIDGADAYRAMHEAVRNAKHYVLVEFYIIKNDHVGEQFKDLLIEKAQEGVKVYVIFDEIGSHKLSWGYVTELRNGGVHVEPFNGKRSFILNIVRVNFRNHRKLVLADGEVCYIGGVNVGREYIGEGELGYWRDTVLEIKGPALLQAQLVFLEDWHWAAGEGIPKLNWEPPLMEDDKSVMMVPSGPADTIPGWRAMVIAMANAAKTRLWIASPYFVPDAAVLASLQAAALRGVDLRMLVPNRNDHLLVRFSTMTYLPETIPYGIKMMAYKKGFLHEKVMLVDDDLATIGTANLDNRSLVLNFELTVLLNDREMNEEVRQMLIKDMENTRLMKESEYLDRNLAYRVVCNIARLLSPVL